jgi:hypothetical protein
VLLKSTFIGPLQFGFELGGVCDATWHKGQLGITSTCYQQMVTSVYKKKYPYYTGLYTEAYFFFTITVIGSYNLSY